MHWSRRLRRSLRGRDRELGRRAWTLARGASYFGHLHCMFQVSLLYTFFKLYLIIFQSNANEYIDRSFQVFQIL